MAKRNTLKQEYYKTTGEHWKYKNTGGTPTTEYMNWLEDKLVKNNGVLADVSGCSCEWKKKVENLMKGLEAQHIEKFMNEANVDEYLEYGIAYMQEVKKIMNNR